MKARLVVADDEPDIRNLVSYMLPDYTILQASDGEEALQLIREEKPDLAILDVMMPGLSGLEVTQALASDPQTATIPIILLSAKGQDMEINAGLSAGASLYLVKPFELGELIACITELLAARKM